MPTTRYKNTVYTFLVFIFVFSKVFIQAKELELDSKYLKEQYSSGYEVLCDLIDKYERPLTILEIDDSTAEYTLKLAEKYTREKISCIALLIEDGYGVAHKVQDKKLPVAVVYPRCVMLDMFKQLARCEHLDIVIISNTASLIDKLSAECISVLCMLGDFTLIELEKTAAPLVIKCIEPATCETAQSNDKTFILYKTRKQGLDIARWTQKLPLASEPRYKVKSNLQEKLFYKKTTRRVTQWKKGINVVTFVMLQGIYPTDALMRENLQRLYRKYPYYNDGVIGNMIVDGTSLQLIDFGDKRRNADMKHCIYHAFKLFNDDGSRLVNPKQRINEYYKSL